jgi:hypothetical protein
MGPRRNDDVREVDNMAEDMAAIDALVDELNDCAHRALVGVDLDHVRAVAKTATEIGAVGADRALDAGLPAVARDYDLLRQTGQRLSRLASTRNAQRLKARLGGQVRSTRLEIKSKVADLPVLRTGAL